MRFLPVANPPNRFSSTTLDYDVEETPGAELQVFEDHSRSILAQNDSPDVGFRWSVHPYRGCQHACSYCADGETLVLMGDARTKKLRDIRVGDEIYGTRVEGAYRRLARTQVLAHWETFKRAYRVVLENGTELVASADHRFLSQRGWKFVLGAEQGPLTRPHLTRGTRMMGLGAVQATPPVTADYKRGYLCGMIRGDALPRSYEYERLGRHGAQRHEEHPFRLALADLAPLRRTKRFLRDLLAIETSDGYVFQAAVGARREMTAIRTHARGHVDAIRALVEWPLVRTREWARGFLSGIFDAEGSFSSLVLRISNRDPRILDETSACARLFGFDTVLDPPGPANGASHVRIRGPLHEKLRFCQLVDPAIRRKWDLEGVASKTSAALRVKSIEDLGFSMRMFDITTGTEDFVANGVVSHNCYARPSHEYLSFGAGTDFERKIVYKPRAPELLREAFDKRSWKGELVVFSGITDCYQPLEASLGLTRACVEVCVEYRNPAGFITKSPIIERDAELLAELARVASCKVSVSIPFWDPEVAKAMEPVVTTPARRMKIVETLAKAGVPVGVSVSPIVPGLNDGDIPAILKAARDAGASHAFFVMLRLPGSVAPVFEAALRDKLPLRAEKVLRRLREMHGGKVYDSRFGHRGRGEGQYAGSIRLLFEQTARRLGLVSDELTSYVAPSTFRRPDRTGQTSFGF